MAADNMQFLKNKFIYGYEEAMERLNDDGSGTNCEFPLQSQFVEMIDILQNRTVITKSTPIAMKDWLYSLNDALIECTLMAEKRQNKEKNNNAKKNQQSFNPAEFWFLRKIRRRLVLIKQKLMEIIGSSNDMPSSSSTTLTRGDSIDSLHSVIHGFDKQLQIIEDLLLRKDGFKGIGIVGLGGSGKTALAKNVLRRSRVLKGFEIHIWVSLSATLESQVYEGEFIKEVVKKMLKIVDSDYFYDVRSHDIREALRRLRTSLSNKRYLMVLDDVWHIDDWFCALGSPLNIDRSEFFDRLSDVLPKENGGAVIVTSRIPKVAEMMVGLENLYQMQPVTDSESIWSIFKDTVEIERVINSTHLTLLRMKDEIVDQCYGLPLAAKTLAKIIPFQIRESEMKSIIGANVVKELYIPKYILLPEINYDFSTVLPTSPLIVFVNLKDDVQLGREVLHTCKELINANQVFDILEEAPEKVLSMLYLNLKKLTDNGDVLAYEIRNRLRVMIVGTDSTVNRLLRVISDMKLDCPPPVAVMPLGTEVNISKSLGWGNRIPRADHNSVLPLLHQVVLAKEIKIDSWHVIMRIRLPNEGAVSIMLVDWNPPFTMFRRVTESQFSYMLTLVAGFWHYFAMGLDARGHIGASCFEPLSWNISQSAKTKIMLRHEWQDLHIPYGIKSIVCLNLPSFLGKENLWGVPNPRKRRDREWTQSFGDDRCIEIIGFKDSWHGLAFLPLVGRGIRLAQARRIRFELYKGAVEHIYMNMDGELWKQPLPYQDDPILIEISYSGNVKMLATSDCMCKSVHDPSSLGADEEIAESDEEEEEDDEVIEARRTFGAAKVFRLPWEADISNLS